MKAEDVCRGIAEHEIESGERVAHRVDGGGGVWGHCLADVVVVDEVAGVLLLAVVEVMDEAIVEAADYASGELAGFDIAADEGCCCCAVHPRSDEVPGMVHFGFAVAAVAAAAAVESAAAAVAVAVPLG